MGYEWGAPANSTICAWMFEPRGPYYVPWKLLWLHFQAETGCKCTYEVFSDVLAELHDDMEKATTGWRCVNPGLTADFSWLRDEMRKARLKLKHSKQ